MELGVSYIPAHLPYHIEADMRHLKEMGCTEVLFALQENHKKILNGALRFGARIAKENDLRPYAAVWGYANTFGGGRMSNILLEDVNMWRVSKDGRPFPLACLNRPKLVHEFVKITQDCHDHGYEGIFVDEPTIQECFCPICQELFLNQFGKDIRESEGTEEYRTFQKKTVKIYTQEVCGKVKALDRNQKTITCIMPQDHELFESVASISELDILGTDPYWLAVKGMGMEDACKYARLLKEKCKEKNKSSQIWLNCWRIPEGLEEDIYTGGKMLAEVGCDSFYTWSFRGGLGTNEECDNPEKAWRSVFKLYRELSQ